MKSAIYHVALDTSVMHKEGLYSGAMVRARRLVDSGALQLYLPDMVGREYVTQLEADVEDKLRRAETELRALQRRVRPQTDWPQDAEAVITMISSLRERAGTSAKAAYEEWSVAFRIKSLAFDPASMPQVLDDYFAGKGAFKKAKNRDDIPDAMIAASILALCKEHKKVHVVAGDAALRKYLGATDGVAAWEKLEDFLDQGEIVKHVRDLDEAQHLEAVLEQLNSSTFHDVLSRRISRDKSLLGQIYVEESDIEHMGNLGIDSFGASLNGMRLGVRVEYGAVAVAGSGRWTIPVSLFGTGRLHYATDFQTFNDLSDFRRADIEEWNFKSGVSELREDVDVVAKGYIDLHFPEGLTNVDLAAKLRGRSATFEVDLEVERAEIAATQWWNLDVAK